MRVRLWIREDRKLDGKTEEPKAVALDAQAAPGPGRLVDVLGTRSADEARRLLALASSPEPKEEDDGPGWLAHRAASRAVRPVPAPAPLPIRHDAQLETTRGGDA